MKWLVIVAILLVGCTAPEVEDRAVEYAECGESCVASCTSERLDEGLIERTITTCVRTEVIEGLVVRVPSGVEDCDAGHDAVNGQCSQTCPDGWNYAPTAASCVQDVCGGEHPACTDPARNPAGFIIEWVEVGETVCERRPLHAGLSPAPLGGDGYYRICAAHNGTGRLLLDGDQCGLPLAGAPGDNTTAQFCFAFSWTATGGGLHLGGTSTFAGAHSDSHDPENPTDLDTPNGDCAWASPLLDGDYEEVDATACLQWEPHRAWHYYPGKATGVHEGMTTSRGSTPQGEELAVRAGGRVAWAIHAPA